MNRQEDFINSLTDRQLLADEEDTGHRFPGVDAGVSGARGSGGHASRGPAPRTPPVREWQDRRRPTDLFANGAEARLPAPGVPTL